LSQENRTDWISEYSLTYDCVIDEDETNAFDVGLISLNDIIISKEGILNCEIINGYPWSLGIKDAKISGY